jgi:16S rRNA (guanine966-N2)-methyltransferase
MRLVAGKFRGRRLHAPEGAEVRPTSDRTREALFGILEGGRLSGGVSPLPGARVLDAFAGTGAVGLEALSRGAANVTFLERYAPALTALRRNVAELAVAADCRVLDRDALHPPPAEAPCQLVFLDPPYNQRLAAPAIAALAARGWIDGASLIVVELMKTEDFDPPAGFELLDSRTYGKARLVFLRRQATEEGGDGN